MSSAEVAVAEDWAAVGRAITDRMSDLGMTQLDLYAKSKVAPATIREIQYNKVPRRRHPRTLEALSLGLEWPADYLAKVLEGESAVPHRDEAGDDLLRKLDHVLDELHELRARVEAVEQRQAGEGTSA
jgi:transcriptional regulator with XRE-family HTH domain